MSTDIKYSNKGITLIALCITIIILCILATITLAALSSDNGIIIKAQEAKNSAEGSQAKDDLILKNIIGYSNQITVNNIGNNTSSGGTSGGNNTVVEHTHTWNSGVVTKEATCIDTGIKTYTCTSCGQTKTETIEALGGKHTWLSEGYFSTCTHEHVEVICCEICGYVALGSINGQHESDYEGYCTYCGVVIWDTIEYENYNKSGLSLSEYMHQNLESQITYYPLNGVDTCLGCAYADGTVELVVDWN